MRQLLILLKGWQSDLLQKIVRYQDVILSLSLGLGLLPFFMLSFYNYPFWDDYWLAGLARQTGAWSTQWNHYMNWGGRYSVAFVQTILSPLKYNWFTGFRLVPILMLGGTLLASQVGVRELTGKHLSWGVSLRWGALLLLLHLAWMPTIYPAFYWFVGSTVYQLPLILTLLLLTTGLKALRAQRVYARRIWYTCSLIGAGCVVGFQEIALLLLGWTLLILFVISWANNDRPAMWCWGGILLSAVIGGIVAVVAPGNFVRMGSNASIYTQIGLVKIIANATTSLVAFLVQPQQVVMLLLTPILVGKQLLQLSRWRPVGFRVSLFGGITFLIGGLAICFLFYAFISTDGIPGRTLNFIWSWLFFAWLLILWAAVPEQVPQSLLHTLSFIQKPVTGFTILLLLSGVERRAWTEWLKDGPIWLAQNNQRLEQLRKAAKQGHRTLEVDGFSGFIPHHIAIIGEPLNPNPVNSATKHNNRVTAAWFGLDSITVKGPIIPGMLSDDL